MYNNLAFLNTARNIGYLLQYHWNVCEALAMLGGCACLVKCFFFVLWPVNILTHWVYMIRKLFCGFLHGKEVRKHHCVVENGGRDW
jgi:hypothetical protein